MSKDRKDNIPMKKIFAILLTLCMLVGMLGVAAVTASAEEATTEETTTEAEDTAGSVVIRVTGLKKDGTVFTPEESEFTDFHTGWVAAATYAKNSTWKNTNDIDRVIVDLLTDWTGVNMSLGGSGEGFSDGAICFPKNTRITLNMNGHTINRARTEWDYNGEVIYIREGADVIINDGTISGGWSGNGAGGIHIDNKAVVTLNNVHVIGNVADDDHGGGIAIHDNAVLTMNGGSFENNRVKSGNGGAVYVYKATTIFNNVEFKNNNALSDDSRTQGTVISAYKGDVTLNECVVDGNGIADEDKGYKASTTLFYVFQSTMTVKKSTFTNNGDKFCQRIWGETTAYFANHSSLFLLNKGDLTVENDCKFSNNSVYVLIKSYNKDTVSVSDSTFTDNDSVVYYSSVNSYDIAFTRCTFNNNTSTGPNLKASTFAATDDTITFNECDLGNSTLDSCKNVVLVDTEAANGTPKLSGSIFSEGSLTNILVILSLAASTVSICLTIAFNKKKAVGATANDEE